MDRPCICPHQIIGNAGVSVTLVILRLFISFHFARCPAGQTYRSASLLYSKGVCLFDYRQLQSLNEQRGAYCFPLPFWDSPCWNMPYLLLWNQLPFLLPLSFYQFWQLLSITLLAGGDGSCGDNSLIAHSYMRLIAKEWRMRCFMSCTGIFIFDITPRVSASEMVSFSMLRRSLTAGILAVAASASTVATIVWQQSW